MSRRAALNQDEVQHLQQQQAQGQSRRPAFLADGLAMLLCRVALGKVTAGSPTLRRAPPGFDSVRSQTTQELDEVYAVFDNNQSYPEYIIHYQ